MSKLNWTSRLRILDYFFTSKVKTYQQWVGSKFGKMSLVSFTPFLTDARGRIFSAGYNNERSTSHWLYSFRCTETSSGSFSCCFLTFSFVPSLQVSFPILWVFLSPSKSFEKWSAFTLGDQGGKERVSYFKKCHCHFGTHLKATIFFVF